MSLGGISVFMTTLGVAPTQTSLQILEEKNRDHKQWSHRTWFPQGHKAPTPNSLAIKAEEKQLTKKMKVKMGGGPNTCLKHVRQSN